MKDFYRVYYDKNTALWYESDLDQRFYCGDQTVWGEVYRNMPLKRRNVFNFNHIRRLVDMVSGHQRRNRKSTVVIPVSNGDQKTADQYSKIFSHINRKEYVLETISDAFSDALTTGLSLLYLWNDYSQDSVSGSLKVEALSYNSFMLDPYFHKRDLSDCNCAWKRSYLSKQQAYLLLPDKRKIIDEVSKVSCENIFTFMPESNYIDKTSLLIYDEYYYLDSRMQKRLVDTQTGESTEWMGKSDEGLDQFLRLYPSVKLVKTEVSTVKLAILLQGTLLYDDINPLGIDSYPFVPVLSYFTPNIQNYPLKLQSMVRGVRDAQYLLNRRKNIELDISESQVNSGWVYKEDSLVNPDDIFLAGQGKRIALKASAQMTDVSQIVAAPIQEGVFKLSESMAAQMPIITGVNEELLGSSQDDNMAGILSALRQSAGLTTLQGLFDQLDTSQRLFGTLMLKAIQANYTPGKVKRIIEEEPTPQFYNKAFGIYDAACEEGFNTTTQKQGEFAQLLKLKELGVPIPDESIIEAATLQNKDKLIEQMNKIKQEQQEREQKIEQVQQQLQLSQAQLSQAKVQSDLSLAKERDSRVYSNIGLMDERRQEAEKDKTQSMLNLVKTLQEIDDIDITQLTKLIQLSQVVSTEASQGNNTEQLGSAIVTGATKDPSAVNTSVKNPNNAGGI